MRCSDALLLLDRAEHVAGGQPGPDLRDGRERPSARSGSSVGATVPAPRKFPSRAASRCSGRPVPSSTEPRSPGPSSAMSGAAGGLHRLLEREAGGVLEDLDGGDVAAARGSPRPAGGDGRRARSRRARRRGIGATSTSAPAARMTRASVTGASRGSRSRGGAAPPPAPRRKVPRARPGRETEPPPAGPHGPPGRARQGASAA